MKTAKEILAMCADYERLALEQLTLTNWRRPEDLAQVREEIRAVFLFPGLDDADHALLVGMAFARRACKIAIRSGSEKKPDGTPAFQPAAVDYHERQFMEMKQSLLSAQFYTSLTSVQKEILNAEYFGV